MRLLIVLAALMATGCVSAPYVCQSTDPDICIIETKLHAIKQAQAEAAFWAMHGAMQQNQPALPRNHREAMCMADPFQC